MLRQRVRSRSVEGGIFGGGWATAHETQIVREKEREEKGAGVEKEV